MLFRLKKSYRRVAFFLAVSIFLIFRCLPSTQKTGSGKITPKHDVETTPRFLYRSTYRETPDLDYERGISNALQAIERGGAPRDGNLARERIWQIMLGRQLGSESRVDDSIELEDENSEWDYTVGYSSTYLLWMKLTSSACRRRNGIDSDF